MTKFLKKAFKMRDVIVVGSGISGLFNAYWCVKAGLRVAIISRNENLDFSEIGLLNSYISNDFKHLSKPANLDKNLLSWLVKFGLNQASKTDKKLQILYHKFAQKSYEIFKNLQDDIGDFDFTQNGNLVVFTDANEYSKALQSIKVGDRDFEILGSDISQSGFLNSQIKGVIRLKQNAQLNALSLVQKLKDYLGKNGVEFIVDEAINYENNGTDVTRLVCKNGVYEARNFIQAAGADKNLAIRLNINLELIPAKVYEISFDSHNAPKQGIFINELLMQISSKNNRVVIQTKPQINSDNTQLKMSEVNAALAKIKPFSSDFILQSPSFKTRNIAVTPHLYPLFGRSERFENLCFCAGFGANEMLFAPIVSKILVEILRDGKPNFASDEILLFSGLFA